MSTMTDDRQLGRKSVEAYAPHDWITVWPFSTDNARFRDELDQPALDSLRIVLGSRLPEGWLIEAVDDRHYLVDPLGRRRVLMYEEKSHQPRPYVEVIRAIQITPITERRPVQVSVTVRLHGQEVFMTIPRQITTGIGSIQFCRAKLDARANAEKALDAEYPKWRDPLAYWD